MLIDALPTLSNTIMHHKHLSRLMAKSMNELAHKSPLIFLLGALRLVNAASSRNIDQKKISSGTQGRLLLELYCVVVIKHVTFFTIWSKLTMAFTYTRLLLNLYTSVFGCGCGFRFAQKFWWIDGFGKKKGMDPRICIPLFTPFLIDKFDLIIDFIEKHAGTTQIAHNPRLCE